MPYHTKAYSITRLREFAGWPGDDQADDAIVFVHPDFSVRKSSLPADHDLIWAGSEAFKRFCEIELAFTPGR
jgi:hypothetical protein